MIFTFRDKPISFNQDPFTPLAVKLLDSLPEGKFLDTDELAAQLVKLPELASLPVEKVVSAIHRARAVSGNSPVGIPARCVVIETLKVDGSSHNDIGFGSRTTCTKFRTSVNQRRAVIRRKLKVAKEQRKQDKQKAKTQVAP